MNKLQTIGWIFLSTLCFFGVFILIQWLSYEVFDSLHIVLNHLILVGLFTGLSWALPKNYGIYGTLGSVFIFLTILILDNNLRYDLILSSSVLILGGVTGFLIKKRRYKLLIVPSIAMLFIFWQVYEMYSKMISYTVSEKDKINIIYFNEQADSVLNVSNKRLTLSKDTVYLVNFTLYHCSPCRQKKKVLKKIEQKFTNAPFRIITIHSIEDKKYFFEHYADKKDTYHDYGYKMTKAFKIPGAPFEFIFDREGRELRRFSGFSAELSSEYEQKTIELIKKNL